VIESSGRTALVEVAERLWRLATQRELRPGASPEATLRASQLRDLLGGHVLPRARSLDAPLLVLILGPTGAGKSSLLNALAGFAASPSGVIRPTTRDLVVVVHPDVKPSLLAEGAPLPLLAGERLQVMAADEAPQGIALIDSPDLDSIELRNRELTLRLAEAADLGIFVTTATRYADRVPWESLARARDRGLPLLVVVNRAPSDKADRAAVLNDVTRLLAEATITLEDIELVVVEEGALNPAIDGLAADTVEPIRRRIAQLGTDREARRALAAQALAGSLAGLAPLVERVADDIDHEAIEVEALSRAATHAFASELRDVREQLSGGSFLRAEALRQWQAYVGADEITRFFSKGIGKLRGTISALIRGTPPAPVAEVREDALADLVALAMRHAGQAARRTAAAWSDDPATRELVADEPGLWSVSPPFEPALRRRLEVWVMQIAEDVQQSGGNKRVLARGASIGVNAAAIAVMVATFAQTGGLTGTEVGVAAATAFLNQKLLEALFGEAALVEMIARARSRLGKVLEVSFDEERDHYLALLPDAAGLHDLAAGLRSAAGEVASFREPTPFEPTAIEAAAPDAFESASPAAAGSRLADSEPAPPEPTAVQR
jgi:energy-coupling factor transporter ATP-binding protein EcfA2